MATSARPTVAALQTADTRLRDLALAVVRPDVKVVSTDVFDTLLWRQVPSPPAAFGLVGDRLAHRGMLTPAVTAMGFASLRAQAEEHARHRLDERSRRTEVTLAEVYELLGDGVLAAGARVAGAALKVELEVERDLLVPDLDVLALLEAAQEAGKAVVAVSDTYFTEDQLRWLLDQPALRGFALDRVFTSCGYRIGKSGGLFDIVLRELDVAPEQIVHLGDNEVADVEVPRGLGIACTPFEQRPAALEAVMAAEARHVSRGPVFGRSPSDAGVAPDLTALRGKLAARAEREALPGALRPYWDHGALVHGPVLTGFAEWVQERAAELGVTRVHAFMREGAFLGPLIDRAGEYGGTEIRCAPLWLNREVLALAAVSDASEEDLRPLLERRRRPTVARLLRTLGLSFADLPRFAGHAETRLDDPTTSVNLFEAIEADESVRVKVVAHAAAARERIVRYVQRELAGDARLVCVDIGWGATAQGLLDRALAQTGLGVDVCGLYLATHAGAAQRTFQGTPTAGFLAEFGLPLEATRLLVRSPEVLEQICMPDHGSQVGLGEDLEPVLEEGERDPVQAAQAATVRDGVLAFQREWARYRLATPGKVAALSGAAELLRPLLVRAVAAPTAEEVAAFAGWLHDENQGSDATEAMVNPALEPMLRHLDPAGLRDLPMHDLYWPFAAAARIDPTWPALIDLAAAGELPWDALSGEADTGPFTVRVGRGAMVDTDDQQVGGRIVRNRFGLSAVHGTLRGGSIEELVIRPSDVPAVVRLDHLELRCHVQGRAEPEVIVLRDPQDFTRLQRVNAFWLNPNLFVAHGTAAELRLGLDDVVGHVFRVDVQVAFATLAIGELLPTPGRVRSVEEAGTRVEELEALVEHHSRTIANMDSSLSWKLTKPLRSLKSR